MADTLAFLPAYIVGEGINVAQSVKIRVTLDGVFGAEGDVSTLRGVPSCAVGHFGDERGLLASAFNASQGAEFFNFRFHSGCI